MKNDQELLSHQIEALQIAIYCNIIKNLLIKHRSLSIIKLAVFSFIIKKNDLLQVECYNAHNSNDLVLKALSQMQGRFDELCSQFPFFFQALDLLIQSNFCDMHQSEIMCKFPPNSDKTSGISFIHLAIKESMNYTDRQFLKEVISVV